MLFGFSITSFVVLSWNCAFYSLGSLILFLYRGDKERSHFDVRFQSKSILNQRAGHSDTVFILELLNSSRNSRI